MSIGQLVTEGVGSFGDVAHVITDGLDISSVVVTAPATIITQAFGSSSAASEFVVTEGFASSTAVTPTPTPTPSVGGKGRKRERYAAKIDGELKFFDSIEELEGYLASLGEEKLEVAEKRAEKVYAGTAVRTGEVPKTPKIVVSGASGEVREAVSRANELLAAQYIQILLKLKEQEDDEDDLLLL